MYDKTCEDLSKCWVFDKLNHPFHSKPKFCDLYIHALFYQATQAVTLQPHIQAALTDLNVVP
jgi:valyl-tRNA synthetase